MLVNFVLFETIRMDGKAIFSWTWVALVNAMRILFGKGKDGKVDPSSFKTWSWLGMIPKYSCINVLSLANFQKEMEIKSVKHDVRYCQILVILVFTFFTNAQNLYTVPNCHVIGWWKTCWQIWSLLLVMLN